jgi:hypothetical protein
MNMSSPDSSELTPQELYMIQHRLDAERYIGDDPDEIARLTRALNDGLTELGGIDKVNQTLRESDPEHRLLKPLK